MSSLTALEWVPVVLGVAVLLALSWAVVVSWPLRSWWNVGARIGAALKYVALVAGGVYVLSWMAWGLGFWLTVAALTHAAGWIAQHWYVLPAVGITIFMLGQLVLKAAATPRCEYCKHSLKRADRDSYELILGTAHPGGLTYRHRDCPDAEGA